MSRKYLSGAEKRKLAAEKKAKEDAAISKVPRINALFAAVSSASTSDSSTTERVEEIDSPATQEQNVIESMEVEHETMEIAIGPMEFSIDTALWDVSKNITSLQNYWISKG